MGRQQTEMAGNINPGVSTLSQAGMPSSPSLGFSQALGLGGGGSLLEGSPVSASFRHWVCEQKALQSEIG